MVNTVDDCRNLSYDWNGYGAEPIPDSVCDRAEKILKLFEGAKLLELFPTACKSIQIEFETDDSYFEIEVYEDHYTTMLALRGKSEEYEHFEFGDGSVKEV
jgi:hypothetical protein